MTQLSTTPALPDLSERVQKLHARMTLVEKIGQIVGYWLDQDGELVAPMAGEMSGTSGRSLAEITRDGIGHYTRVYGTRPVDPAARASWLRQEQQRLRDETRLGVPALVHEECLTGLAAWQAATFPSPPAWGASFDPDLVEEMAGIIGTDMWRLGIHQGLAPVLDVIRDPRFGRVEEAIAEDPYLVGTIGTAYVRGLQDAGPHATLKHFIGYSGSRAGRNHAPVSVGRRELADVYGVPFEMALLDGGARSVMNSYADVDGMPVAADASLLTGVLRDQWGFDGTVVSDYFSVAFLQKTHQIAADRADAATLALAAGIDVELPSGDAFLALLDRLEDGADDGHVAGLIDRAALRALAQKEELGLLDGPPLDGLDEAPIDLDSARHRDVARRLAEESVVLLANDGLLPLGDRPLGQVAVIGPNADRPEAMMGCYSFVNHVLPAHPEVPLGIEVPSVAEALRTTLPGTDVIVRPGCEVSGQDRSGFADAVAAAASADVAVVVVGDQAGLFGRGTVGEGNDVESLELPGLQRELVEAVTRTGTPTALVLISGRPYAIDWALDGATKPVAVVQTFFPGEEGGPAIARVLAGLVNPSGRLPVSLPRSAGAQPSSYLHAPLGGRSEVSSVDPTPVRPFGFGLSYTSFEYTDLVVDLAAPTRGDFEASVTVTNTGSVAGTDVVQLYGHDVVASVARPVCQLLGYTRVTLEPGESVRVSFDVPTARLAFSDRTMTRVVEPGEVEIWVAASAGERPDDVAVVELTGPVHAVTREDRRITEVKLRSAERPGRR